MKEVMERIKKHADSLESVPHNKQFRADLYALLNTVDEYAYTDLQEYEGLVGFPVNEPIKMGWRMARLKLGQLK